MKQIRQLKKRGSAFLLALLLVWGVMGQAMAAEAAATDAALNDTAEYLYRLVKSPQVGSIGGEWAVLGLARSGYTVPDRYYQDYYATVENYVKACGGVLHDKKYTEYSRLIVALTALGKDPSRVAGYNLLTPLGDYEKTIWQGLNGPIWALIALDSGKYEVPVNAAAKTQATRQKYIERILQCRLSDGGWSLFGGTAAASQADQVSDPDITGMALQALAKYQDQPAVQKATKEALMCMSAKQNTQGGFSSWGTPNSESCVQMIVALCELGIPLSDSRFVKNGKTMADNLMTFYQKGAGFRHTADGSGSNQMATEQAFYGLVALQRAQKGKNSLYRMSDSLKIPETSETLGKGQGLAGKDSAVKAVAITRPGVTFADISGHVNQPAIEALAARQIINGKTEQAFEPNATMTRAEFAAIVVKALGLSPKEEDSFQDVKASDWFAGYVGAACSRGIVNGKGAGQFQPYGVISRQEAAVMAARAAKLCGMNTAYEGVAARDVLAQFSDYMKTADWARPGLAFCYDQGILDSSAMTVEPGRAVLRGEIAQMLYHLLAGANLL